MNPFDLDWGTVTPEGWNNEKQEALHVYNVALTKGATLERAKRFIVGRIIHFSHHIPSGATQKVVIDARGQGFPVSYLRKFKQGILDLLKIHGFQGEPDISFYSD